MGAHSACSEVGGWPGQQGQCGWGVCAHLADSHDILVVTEDGQGVPRQGARRHVQHAGRQLTRNLVHVGDLQAVREQSKRRRAGGAAGMHWVEHSP